MTLIQDLPTEILRLIIRSFDRSITKSEFLAKLHPALFVVIRVCKLWSSLALELLTDYYPWYKSEWTTEFSRAMMLRQMFWELQHDLEGEGVGYFHEQKSIARREQERQRQSMCGDGRNNS
jgi:hypothetical protein